MLVCPSCGEENPERARFCLNCGTPLREPLAPAEERKVVTVLFCDLVGFTARSDKADPEDVKARLRPFHARLQREINAFGGTLDKFIGDAALGVFGSPVAHEDDAERGVRAGLAIVDAMQELNAAHPDLQLAVRVGINTGEAVVAYGTGPQIGEAVTGDVVNTASRLQGVAPVGGVVVGAPTYLATRAVFDYEALPAVSVKGKAEPLEIWRAIRARGRVGSELTRSHGTPFVGRSRERRLLRAAFDDAVGASSLRLVTIVGEPGVGKSRLVLELERELGAAGEDVTWRVGRCLPYGEGMTFWALGEIVKSHAGILESDDGDRAMAKLDRLVEAEFAGEPDRRWLRQRVAPLVGGEAAAPADRDESFTAWHRFLTGLARQRPAVFVFDDVQWADPALLGFIRHVVERGADVPAVLLCTARPELFEREPGWGSEGSPGTRIDVGPLAGDETADLVDSMVDPAGDGGGLSADERSAVVERAGGNPLFVEELVRMVHDRVSSVSDPSAASDLRSAFPDSIQALIAGRLDLVGGDRKAMLQDAAVVGKVFWPGALAAIGGRERSSVATSLEDLAQRELVRRQATSSMEGEDEYSFWHGLIQEVAYAQIPRAARAARHEAAARWIEGIAGGRVEDHAEILAHHYTLALELARAAGSDRAEDLLRPAVRFLGLGGDHALGLDVGRAQAQFGRALELVPVGDPDRASILVRWADAARQAGDSRAAIDAMEEAIDDFRERGDRVAAGRAMSSLASVLLVAGDPRQADLAAEGVRLLESEPPGADLVAAYGRVAGVKVVEGDHRATIEWADRAIALAERLHLRSPARVLGFRAYAKASLGDAEGLEEMRRALSLAVERGEGRDAAILYNNLAVALLPVEGPAAVLALTGEGIEFSERRGITELALALATSSLDQLYDLGQWDRVLGEAAALGERAKAAGDVADLLQVRWATARILNGRGRVEEAGALAEWLVGAARASGGVEDAAAAFTVAAGTFLLQGEERRALELIAELAGSPQVFRSPVFPAYVSEMVRIAVVAGDADLASGLADGVEPIYPLHEHARRSTRAILAEARGELPEAARRYADAAERWDRFGVLPERAHALLGQGRVLLALGDGGAAPVLGEARTAFEELGAQPSAALVEHLLGGAGSQGGPAEPIPGRPGSMGRWA